MEMPDKKHTVSNYFLLTLSLVPEKFISSHLVSKAQEIIIRIITPTVP